MAIFPNGLQTVSSGVHTAIYSTLDCAGETVVAGVRKVVFVKATSSEEHEVKTEICGGLNVSVMGNDSEPT